MAKIKGKGGEEERVSAVVGWKRELGIRRSVFLTGMIECGFAKAREQDRSVVSGYICSRWKQSRGD